MSTIGTEQEILMVVEELQEASGAEISRKIGFSPGYVQYLCKYLVRHGYLKQAGGRYTLARAAERMRGIASDVQEQSLELWRQETDKKMIEQVAKAVAKEVKKEIKDYQYGKKEEEIQIKTDFTDLMEWENTKMESNLGEIKTTKEKEATINQTVELLKGIRRSKHLKEDKKQRRKD